MLQTLRGLQVGGGERLVKDLAPVLLPNALQGMLGGHLEVPAQGQRAAQDLEE